MALCTGSGIQPAPVRVDTAAMASDLHRAEHPARDNANVRTSGLAAVAFGGLGVGLVLLGAWCALVSVVSDQASNDAVVRGGSVLVPGLALPLVVMGAGVFVVRRASQRRLSLVGPSLAALAAVLWWAVVLANTN